MRLYYGFRYVASPAGPAVPALDPDASAVVAAVLGAPEGRRLYAARSAGATGAVKWLVNRILHHRQAYITGQPSASLRADPSLAIVPKCWPTTIWSGTRDSSLMPPQAVRN